MDKKVWIIGGVIILGGATAYILLNKKAAAAQNTVPSSGDGTIPAGATGAITPQGGATGSTPGVLPGGTTLYDSSGAAIGVPPPTVIPLSGALSAGQGGNNNQGIGAGINLNTNPNTSPLTITSGSIAPTQTDPVSGIITTIPAGAIGDISPGTPAPSSGGTSALGGASLGLNSGAVSTNPDPWATGNNAPYAQAPAPDASVPSSGSGDTGSVVTTQITPTLTETVINTPAPQAGFVGAGSGGGSETIITGGLNTDMPYQIINGVLNYI